MGKTRVEPLQSGSDSSILKAVSELYKAYYQVGGNETERRIRIEEALGRLMNAWDKMLG